MTMTPNEQTPSKCKHYGYLASCQAREPWIRHKCIMKLGYHCPDYQPKEKKDNNINRV